MPRVNRRPKRRSAGYTQDHVHHLLFGVYLCPGHAFATLPRNHAGDYTDFNAMRIGWDILRAELLPQFIAEHPGHRPFAWWLFDAPERRQRTDNVVHPFDDRIRRQHVEGVAKRHPAFRETAYRLFYGRPGCLCVRDDFEAEYETEATYLHRLNLLTPAEREELFQ